MPAVSPLSAGGNCAGGGPRGWPRPVPAGHDWAGSLRRVPPRWFCWWESASPAVPCWRWP